MEGVFAIIRAAISSQGSGLNNQWDSLKKMWRSMYFFFFAQVERAVNPSVSTETLRTRVASKARSRGKDDQRTWCWRCAGESACLRRRRRRTECQHHSPGTPPLCERLRRLAADFSLSCHDRRNNLHRWRTSDSRTCRSVQTSRQQCVLFSWFLCTPPICKPLHSTPPPSSSDPSDRRCTAPVATGQTCLGDQDTAAVSPKLPSFCVHWVPETCWLCLCPQWVQRSLMETRRHNMAAV